MLPQLTSTSQVLTASRVALLWGAAVLLVLPSARLRAGDELPKPDSRGAQEVLADCQPVGVVKCPARFEASATILLLQASNSNPIYATVTHPYPDLTPHWNNRAIDNDFNPAFNVGVRYLLEGGGDVRLGWTHLNSFDNGSTVSTFPLPEAVGIPPPNLPPQTQSINPPYLVGPPLPFAIAEGVMHTAYDAVDLEAGPTFSSGSWRLRAFAGAQYAHIGQRLSTNFRTFSGAFTFRDVADSLFNGAGPRGGLDVSCVAGNFELLGGFAAMALIGRRESSIEFLSSSPQTLASGIPLNMQSLTSPNTTQVVPGIDARLGAGYSFPVGTFGVLRCEAGYQAAVYISAVNQYTLSEVENNLSAQNIEGTAATFLRTAAETQHDFLVHGAYVKFSFQF